MRAYSNQTDGEDWNPVKYLRAVAGSHTTNPPFALRNEKGKGMILAHEVNPEVVEHNKEDDLGLIDISLRYLAISGLDQAVTSINLHQCLDPEHPVFCCCQSRSW